MSSAKDNESEPEDEVFEAAAADSLTEETSCKVLLSEDQELTPNVTPRSEEEEQRSPFLNDDDPTTLSSPHTPEQLSRFARGASFCRHRSSMTKSRAKELKREVAGYKREVVEYKREVAGYKQHIEFLEQKLKETEKRVVGLLEGSQYYVYITGECKNVQVGSDNSIVDETAIEDTMEAIDGLEELVQKLTSAVEVNIQERVTIEEKLDKTEVCLEELRNSVKDCTDTIHSHGETNDAKLCDLKRMLETSTSELTDQNVIADGVAVLKTLHEDTITANEFPSDVRSLAKLMMKRFGFLKWPQFAQRLGVKPSSITNIDLSIDTDIDQQTCVQILVKFLQSPTNNADKLMKIIRMYDEEKTKEKMDVLRRRTICGATQPETKAGVAGTGTHDIGHGANGFHRLLDILIKKVDLTNKNITVTKCMTTENNKLLKDIHGVGKKEESNVFVTEEMFV